MNRKIWENIHENARVHDRIDISIWYKEREACSEINKIVRQNVVFV